MPSYDSALGGRANAVAFSNDCRYFSVSTTDGFQIRDSDTCEVRLNHDVEDGTTTASMLGNSEIIGFTNSNVKPRQLTLYNSRLRQQITALSVQEPIIRSILTLHWLCIVSSNTVHLFNHSREAIKPLGRYATSSNSQGICELGETACVFPARSPGQIHVLQLSINNIGQHEVKAQKIVPAHNSSLRALCLTKDEEIVCSASENGTLIRMHSTKSAARLGELRRGVNPAEIYSLAASPSGGQLAVTSNTNTLHIFNLPTGHLQERRVSVASSNSPQGPNATPSGRVQDAKRSPSPLGSSPPVDSGSSLNWQKWGSLAKMPFAPRVFTDVYSFATASFDPGQDDYPGVDRIKGLVGWVEDETIVVLSAGKDARYERFELKMEDNEPTSLRRVGWSRYMRPN